MKENLTPSDRARVWGNKMAGVIISSALTAAEMMAATAYAAAVLVKSFKAAGLQDAPVLFPAYVEAVRTALDKERPDDEILKTIEQ